MATFRGYKFKVSRTAILKNGLTVGEKRACPVKSTGHDHLIFVSTSTTSSRTSYRSRRLFYFLKQNPSLALSVAPPFRKTARSHRLFACKRALRGFCSLPPPCGSFVFFLCYKFSYKCLKHFLILL